MSGKQKKKWTARLFESCGQVFIDPNTGVARKDTSANLYLSMLLHPAFTSLKNRQKILYATCKSQFYGSQKPVKDFPDMEFTIDGKQKKLDDMTFYLNWGLVKRYGIYSRTGQHEFYNDMKELTARGFIELISSGRATKRKSIYRFSDKWKQWSG